NRSPLSLLMNMQLLRWSKAKPPTTGQDTRLERHSYLTRDWMPRTITALPAEVEKCLLTSPLIEQAITPTAPWEPQGSVLQGCECVGDSWTRIGSKALLPGPYNPDHTMLDRVGLSRLASPTRCEGDDTGPVTRVLIA